MLPGKIPSSVSKMLITRVGPTPTVVKTAKGGTKIARIILSKFILFLLRFTKLTLTLLSWVN